jgi:hypothetical protein
MRDEREFDAAQGLVRSLDEGPVAVEGIGVHRLGLDRGRASGAGVCCHRVQPLRITGDQEQACPLLRVEAGGGLGDGGGRPHDQDLVHICPLACR